MSLFSRKKLTLLITTTAIMLITVSFSIAKKNASEKTSYLITINEQNNKLTTIKFSFTLKDSLIYMNPGANHLPKRWATFVHNVKAINSEGKPIVIKELPDAKWKVFSPLNEKIELTYEVKLDHEDYDWSGGIDGVAYTKEWGVFYTGRSLFILNGEERNHIKVDFVLPQHWHVTTPWSATINNKKSFTANNLTDLTSSIIFAGLHEEISVIRDGFELVFALGGDDIIAQKDEFKNLAEGILDYYIELMGGIPNPSPENKFKKSVVIINSSSSTDGEVIGNNISILIEKDGDQFSKTISRFIFAHEFFHLWNGKSFSPIGDDTEWFKEGFSNYYTIKALRQVGFLNDASYLDILSNFFYQKYSSDKGIGELSMTMGEEKHDHWGLIYGGGMFVGISQDIIIRNATNNKKSVDDLLRKLFKKYGGINDGYSLEELRSSMSELSGIEQSDFFSTYVIGTKKIPIANYLTIIGLDAKIENGNLIISKNNTLTPKQRNIINGLFGQINNN